MLANLANSPDYRARMISPRDITSLWRRWPSSLFADMHKRQADMETLRHDCKQQYDSEVGGGRAGTIVVYMYHLELSQLWRCPVEWCSVWKGTVQDCLDDLRGKHNGAQLVVLKTLG